jgi:hypothetical protein
MKTIVEVNISFSMKDVEKTENNTYLVKWYDRTIKEVDFLQARLHVETIAEALFLVSSFYTLNPNVEQVSIKSV